MILRAALDHLCAGAVAGKAAQMASYHKAPREYLGTANPHIDTCVRAWRPALDVAGQVALARELWRTDIHEARIAAAKLLTRRRIEGDGQVWDEIQSWAPDFDAWAIADHAAAAGAARLWAVPARLDDLDAWTRDGSF
ncbi:MAG: DNA alkylation repair protein, partial [Pseudomonadota bacterium]